MAHSGREQRLSALFVTLADTLVADYDTVDLLHTLVEECVGILDVAEGGIVLADATGRLHVVASAGASGERLEELQLRALAGPCVDCFAESRVVTVDDIETTDRWPDFERAALAEGIRSVHAVPLRLRDQTIGALNLFSRRKGSLSADDAAVATALAAAATIGILQERAIHDRQLVAEQLQSALDSRVLIEQAKGIVAQAQNLPVDEAFGRLRDYARRNNARLREVAEAIVSRRSTPL